jgi:hypothetical protein
MGPLNRPEVLTQEKLAHGAPRTCQVDGGEASGVARGMCNRHYQAWYRRELGERAPESTRRWRERTNYLERQCDKRAAAREEHEQEWGCEECGGSFTTAVAHRRFCCERCRKRAERRRQVAVA